MLDCILGIPGRQPMKVRVYSFAKLQTRSFLKWASERNFVFIIANLSLLGCGFRGELGSPTGSPCCHIPSSLPIACSQLLQCPSSPADRAGSAGLLSPDQGTHLGGWGEENKILSHPKRKQLQAVCLHAGYYSGYMLLPSQRATALPISTIASLKCPAGSFACPSQKPNSFLSSQLPRIQPVPNYDIGVFPQLQILALPQHCWQRL